MKNWLLGGAALPAFIVGPAMAADLPVKAPAPAAVTRVYDWTGLYVGLNAGGAWGRSDLNTSASCANVPGFNVGPFFLCQDVGAVDAAGSGSMSDTAFVGGGQIGYNYQINRAVFGVELDFDSFNIKSSREVTGNVGQLTAVTLSSSASTNWLFTARGRVGWAFNNLLPYVTGGLAVTDLHASNSFQGICCGNPVHGPGEGSGSWSASDTKVGWTVGGGLEWAFAQNWTAKAEYLYVHFNSLDASGLVTVGSGYASAISTSTDLTANIARVGINYKF